MGIWMGGAGGWGNTGWWMEDGPAEGGKRHGEDGGIDVWVNGVVVRQLAACCSAPAETPTVPHSSRTELNNTDLCEPDSCILLLWEETRDAQDTHSIWIHLDIYFHSLFVFFLYLLLDKFIIHIYFCIIVFVFFLIFVFIIIIICIHIY